MMFASSFEAGLPICHCHRLQNSVGFNPTQHKPIMSSEEEFDGECSSKCGTHPDADRQMSKQQKEENAFHGVYASRGAVD